MKKLGNNKESENLILVDYVPPEKWEFQEGMEKATNMIWKTDSMVANVYHTKFGNLLRYGIYFLFPLKYVFRIRQYGNILAWQQFFGLILGGYFRLFCRLEDVPNIFVMEFIYRTKNGIKGKIYKQFISFLLHSKCICKIFVFTTNEKRVYARTFGLPESKFEVIRLGIEDHFDNLKCNISDGGYYIAPGRSNRDWEYLLGEWDTQRKLRIICDNFGGHTKPEIQVLKKCHGEDYMLQLLHCHAVIVPLQDENISSGQLVILQAKMLGKPVITTDSNTVSEYFEDNEDGYIVKKNEKGSLQKALKKLDDPGIYSRICESARRNFREGYSLLAMGQRVGKNIVRDDLEG